MERVPVQPGPDYIVEDVVWVRPDPCTHKTAAASSLCQTGFLQEAHFGVTVALTQEQTG